MELTEKKSLIVDLSSLKDDFSEAGPLVCISLEGTLFRKIRPSNISSTPKQWLDGAIEITYSQADQVEKNILIQRPGAADLLVELSKHVSLMVYSSQTSEFIDEALLQLSIVQGDPDNCTDLEYARAEAYYNLDVWSRDQCIEAKEGYRKSLGTLSEFFDSGINDIWLIDHKPEQVDFSNHVICVSEFFGDPDDRELYKLIDKMFIN